VEVLGKGVRATTQPGNAMHRDAAGADAFDLRAQQRHEAAELLHVRFAGGVHQRAGAMGQHGAEHEVLGGGDAGVIQPVVVGQQAAALAIARADDQRFAAAFDLAAETLHHLHVRIDLAHAQGAALHVVFDARHAKTCQQRRHQHDRGLRISSGRWWRSGSKSVSLWCTI
jgi:hypothetical protein